MTLVVRGLRVLVGDRVLVAGLDLDLAPGAGVAVRGPSGAGKTRLLRAIAGLDPVAAGTLTLDGRAPTDWGWPAWRARVVLVPQDVPALPGTPRDLQHRVAGLAAQRALASDVVGAVDPAEYAIAWGLPAEALDQAWASLSGGEAKRALLAIALSREPAVLLLDEPTAALDEEATVAVEATLAGRTRIFVTHDDAQADRLAGQVVQIGDGR